MKRVNQRQGFLVSAVIHLTVLMMLLAQPPSTRDPEGIDPSEMERRQVVILPPAEVLRQLVPAPSPPARPRPVPVPTPPPQAQDPTKKDRISIGPPSPLQSKGPLILRREDDLTKVPKGQPDAQPRPPAPTPRPVAPAPTPGPQVARGGEPTPETPGRQGLRLPSGLFGPPVPQGDGGSQRSPGRIGPSVEELTRRMSRNADAGLPTGTGQNLYGLRFDPRGADFTIWVNDFKNQVYRNWIVPQAAYLGYGGHVDFQFVIERDGTMSSLNMLKSSGTVSLDRAARNALTSSRFMPLPDDYGPARLTIDVSFHYGPDRNS